MAKALEPSCNADDPPLWQVIRDGPGEDSGELVYDDSETYWSIVSTG